MIAPGRKAIAGAAATAALIGAVALWPRAEGSIEASAGTTTTTVEASSTTSSTTGATSSSSTTTTSAPATSSTTGQPPTTRPPATTTPPVTASVAPTSPPPTTTTAPAPPYRSSISTVTAQQLGSSYTPGRGCAEPDALRMVTLTHWGMDGAVREGRIVVAAGRAQGVAGVFAQLYTDRFPIERMVPIDAYGGDDQASMRANNTSGYNCRTVAGSSRLSNHAFGEAIDVNPLLNPYVKGSSVDPPEGRPWADRSRRDPGMIHPDDATVRAFAAAGWKWGGYWSSGQDYQHFSTSGT